MLSEEAWADLIIQRRGGQPEIGNLGTAGGEARVDYAPQIQGVTGNNLLCVMLYSLKMTCFTFVRMRPRGEETSPDQSLTSVPSESGQLFQRGLCVPGVEDLEHQANICIEKQGAMGGFGAPWTPYPQFTTQPWCLQMPRDQGTPFPCNRHRKS